MTKIFYGTLWIILTVIGVILMIPYGLLQIITEKIEDILEILEFKMMNKKGEKNGCNTEF